jgi:hypothetical protein
MILAYFGSSQPLKKPRALTSTVISSPSALVTKVLASP